MSDQNQLAVAQPPAFLAVAGLTGLDAKYLVDTVKRQCFKGEATDAQVDAFISIACEMKVNPLLPGMLYAYPISGGGIVPIMGPSGVYKKLAEHPEVLSWETEVFPADVSLPPTHAITKIWRKGVDRPLQYTALLSEWKINSNPNWNSRPRHMLALRSLKHCANQIIHGIPYDEDDRHIMMQNVTGTGEDTGSTSESAKLGQTENKRPEPKPRATRGAAGAKNAEVVVTAEEQKATEPAKEAEGVQKAMEARQAKIEPKPEPKSEPVKAPESKPAEGEKAAPLTALKDGERVTVTAKVETMEAVAGNANGQRFAAIKALLSGGFNGEVRQREGGAKFINNGAGVEALPPWKVGAVLSFELLGQKSAATSGPLQGKVVVWVQSIATPVQEGETME